MMLEKLVKNGKKAIAGLVAPMAIAVLVGCAPENAEDKPKSYPAAQIQANFGDGLSGKVNYEICGEIPFNQINYTLNGVPYAISFNDLEMVDNGNSSRCFYREMDIVDGENSVTAVADENPNVEEQGSYSFKPATEEEARESIKNVLLQKGNYVGFEEGTTIEIGGIGVFDADFLIEPISGKYSIINYGNGSEDLISKIQEAQTLRDNGVPVLLLSKTPSPFNESETGKFADNGYQ